MAKRPLSRTMPVLLRTSTGVEGCTQVPIETDEFVVGRSLTSSCVIPDVTISRRHCVIRRAGDKWTVTDESTTGVFINGVRVQKGAPVILKAGDEIKFGFKWDYIFCLPEDNNAQKADVPDLKKAKMTKDDKLQIQSTQNGEQNEAGYKLDEPDVSVACGHFLEDNESKLQTQEDKEDKQNALDDLQKEDEISLREQEELKKRLLQAQKLTENINREREQVLSVLIERDQQLLNLQKNTQMEKNALKKKLKELQALLAEKEKQEEEDKRRLEEETKRVQMLEEEKKKQEEYNKMFVEQLLRDIEKREKAAKQRIQDVLKDLHKDRIAIESEIKEKSEAKEDVGRLVEELEAVKRNLMMVDHKREVLENELTEAKTKVSVCTVQAREEILHNLGVLMETELQCSICNELFLTATTLTCNHTFCKFCISEWKKKKKECPICRRGISSEYRSLSLDNFINKMVESLSEEMKQKRTELIAEREALEKKSPKAKKERKKRSRNSSSSSNASRMFRLTSYIPPMPRGIPIRAGPIAAQPTMDASTSGAPLTSSASTSAASTSAAFTSATSMPAASTSGTLSSTASTLAASTSTAVTIGPSTSASPLLTTPELSASATARTAEAVLSPQSPAPSVSPPLADYVIVDLSNSSLSEGDSPGSSDYSSDSSYAEGVAGSYYGGYGNCYHCGRSGHWANGCPDMY